MKRLIHIIRRRTMNSEGFTLLEAMISMAVFAVGILGMLTLQTTSIKSNTLAEDVQTNTITAMAEIEELMATDFLDQRLAVPKQYTCTDPRYTFTVTPLDDKAIPGAMRVQIDMEFKPNGVGAIPIAHADGTPQSITLKIVKPDIDRVTP
jgi:Tfp pilus assembly protein PilV